MTPLNHPNLVKLYGGCWNEGPDKLCLVLEFCPMGSLRTLMDGTKRLGTWADPRFNLALGIAQCFKYLHHGLNSASFVVPHGLLHSFSFLVNQVLIDVVPK